MHSSSLSSKASQEAAQKYDFIARIMQKHGTPNPQYATDLDMTYGELSKHTDGLLNGLLTLLKNMKKQKRIDFSAPFPTKDTIITLVTDYNQEADFGQLSDEQIRRLEGGTGHESTSGW